MVKIQLSDILGCDLASEHERYLVEAFQKRIIMTDYPKEIRFLYENKCRWQNGARHRRAVPAIIK